LSDKIAKQEASHSEHGALVADMKDSTNRVIDDNIENTMPFVLVGGLTFD